MSACLKCDKKDMEISNLKSQVSFHKGEQERWRGLFNEQRGGETFNDLQKQYANSITEISMLKLELKKEKLQNENDV